MYELMGRGKEVYVLHLPQEADLPYAKEMWRQELEEKEKTPAQKTAEAVILILPLLCGCIAMMEYLLLPNNSRNGKPWSYVWVLGAAMAAYLVCLLAALLRKKSGKKQFYEKLRRAFPRCSYFWRSMIILP